MNCRTDIVDFFFGGGRLFQKSYVLEGRLLESGPSLDHLQYAKAIHVVPLCSPVIFLYNLFFHLRTTNQLHRESFQITSPSHLHHHWNQQQLSNIF